MQIPRPTPGRMSSKRCWKGEGDCWISNLISCIQSSQVRWDFSVRSRNGVAIIPNPFPKVGGLQIVAPAAISAHSRSAEWQPTAPVMQRRADGDGWIDRRPHMRTCLLINSCWQRANTLGSSVEMSVMPAISLHAFQVGCPQPVTVGY